MVHPHAFPGSKGGFIDGFDEKVNEGDRVFYTIDRKIATMDEALHDGDAFVSFEDGSYGTVKWRHLIKVK